MASIPFSRVPRVLVIGGSGLAHFFQKGTARAGSSSSVSLLLLTGNPNGTVFYAMTPH